LRGAIPNRAVNEHAECPVNPGHMAGCAAPSVITTLTPISRPRITSSSEAA
jgi:hypothetical protein